jgi:[acyl-carrier-protein] S-malonyltransferase
MGKSLADQFDVCRETLRQADSIIGESLTELCFDGPEEALALTQNTQPAVLAVSIAAYRLLESRGIKPVFVAGHSLGEYSAHVAAGTISFADALRTVRRRGQYMQEAVPVGSGAMAAVLGLDESAVRTACEEVANGEVVSPANLNAPGQIVISGSASAVQRASERAKELGARRVLRLPVSAPFHCSLMKPAQKRLKPELGRLIVSDPKVPVIANVDAEAKTDARSSLDALIEQVSAPVRWEAVVRRLLALGVTTFVEVGPGTVLNGLIKKIDRKSRTANFGSPDGFSRVETLFNEVHA